VTVIVGLAAKGRVYIGGDSSGFSGWDKQRRRDTKVFALGEAVIGFTSSYRMGQIIRFHMKPPVVDAGEDEFDALGARWIPELRQKLKEHGYSTVDNNREDGGTFIVGWRGRVFVVHDDFQIAESADGFNSVGIGANYALGALHGMNGHAPKEKVRIALEAAERFSGGVGGPFTILSTKAKS
jgi:ATP-dependent protease HslVU (ClpYQ) peptidase subunit